MTEVHPTTGVHRIAVVPHRTIAEVLRPAAVTAEEVRIHPEVHHSAVEVLRRQGVATAEEEVHQADIDDNRIT